MENDHSVQFRTIKFIAAPEFVLFFKLKMTACQITNRQCFADSSFFRNWSRHSVPSFQFIHFNLIPLLVHASVLCNLGTSEVEHGH